MTRLHLHVGPYMTLQPCCKRYIFVFARPDEQRARAYLRKCTSSQFACRGRLVWTGQPLRHDFLFLHSKVCACVCVCACAWHIFLSSNVANNLGARLQTNAKPRAQCRPDTAVFSHIQKQKHKRRTSVVSKLSLAPHIDKHFCEAL